MPAALNPMQQALVEQAVASEARHFIGTHHSTFSLEIHFERASRHLAAVEAAEAAGGGAGGTGEGIAEQVARAWAGRDASMTKGGDVMPLCDPSSPHAEQQCEPWW